jgi:hypothetical protein
MIISFSCVEVGETFHDIEEGTGMVGIADYIKLNEKHSKLAGGTRIYEETNPDRQVHIDW